MSAWENDLRHILLVARDAEARQDLEDTLEATMEDTVFRGIDPDVRGSIIIDLADIACREEQAPDAPIVQDITPDQAIRIIQFNAKYHITPPASLGGVPVYPTFDDAYDALTATLERVNLEVRDPRYVSAYLEDEARDYVTPVGLDGQPAQMGIPYWATIGVAADTAGFTNSQEYLVTIMEFAGSGLHIPDPGADINGDPYGPYESFPLSFAR